ncbi:MAG: glycosyltransferase family 9 protein [Bryobacteraceae bacterium]
MKRLLIRPGAIGDCILALPAMEFLQVEYTEVWVPTAVAPLLRFTDHVRAIAATGLDLLGIGDHPPPESLLATLESFDSIVSWYGENRPEFREAAEAVNPNWTFLKALPPDGYGLHAADFFAQQVGAPAGLSPSIPVRQFVQHGAVVIHPFSGSRKKNWPLERFQELATRLDEPVKWLAGPEDVLPGADRFEDLGALAGWLAGARVYIGNDSGITHLAAAAGTPTVALFGPTEPDVWGPRGVRVRCVRQEPIAELPMERVVEAFRDVLKT